MANNALIKKFILFLFCTSIIPLILIGTMSYNVSKNIIQEQVHTYMMGFMQGQKDFMELLMGEVDGLIANISSVEEIRTALENDYMENDDYTKLATQVKIGHILSGYTHLNGLVSIDLFTANNNHYHVGDTLNIEEINTMVKDKIYQKVLESPGNVIWLGIEDNVNKSSQHKKVITAAKALKTIDPKTLQEKTAGVILVNYSLDNFYDYFYKSSLGEDAYIMIMDGENRLVFSTKKNQIGSFIETSFAKRLMGNEGAYVGDIGDQKMLITYCRSEKSNWYLVSITPVSSLIARTAEIRNYTILGLGFFLIIVFLAAWVVSKRVVRPINKITNHFKEMQEGTIDLNLRLEEKTKDEIGELTKWFNMFLNSLVAKRNVEEELRKAHDELEKRVLERTAELAIMNNSLVEEIAHRKKSEQELKYISFHDALTGLNNRTSFEQKMSQLRKTGCNSLSIVICDVNGLKLVNDSMGHRSGDLLLINTAHIIKESIGENDFVARIGGDEFAIILYTSERADIQNICEQIAKQVERYNRDHANLPISISLGFASCTQANSNLEEVFKEADNNMYREKLYRSKSARSAIVKTMMKAMEARDFITEGHLDRVQRMAVNMGCALGFSDSKLTDLRLFAQFHDIGKVGVSDNILLKPGFLTQEETAEMRRHTEIGYRIAQSAPDLVPIADWILKHHEWWDGSGYPLNLKGEDIPLECRILTIVDSYDAMTSDRPYRKAMTHEAAIAELNRCAGTQFDPELVKVFVQSVEERET